MHYYYYFLPMILGKVVSKNIKGEARSWRIYLGQTGCHCSFVSAKVFRWLNFTIETVGKSRLKFVPGACKITSSHVVMAFSWNLLKQPRNEMSATIHRKKIWSHFDLKSWVSGGTKIRPGISSNWRIFESNWLDMLRVKLTRYVESNCSKSWIEF